MGYRIVPRPTDGYGPRPGLEGPYRYPNGRVLYYDPQAGRYWDPHTDFYVDPEEVADLQQSVFGTLASE